MTVFSPPPAIESPCIRVCAIDPASGLCRGCGRDIAEITHWIGLSAAERSRIMAELPQRLASLHRPNAKPANQA
jgi:predicted Fe-S protein YdhL (DUF1289 family)